MEVNCPIKITPSHQRRRYHVFPFLATTDIPFRESLGFYMLPGYCLATLPLGFLAVYCAYRCLSSQTRFSHRRTDPAAYLNHIFTAENRVYCTTEEDDYTSKIRALSRVETKPFAKVLPCSVLFSAVLILTGSCNASRSITLHQYDPGIVMMTL
jgi:hypothetical protein